MTSKSALLIRSVLIALSLSGSAQAEPLSEAVKAALAYHPSVEAAQAFLNGSHQETEAAQSGYYPELQVSSSVGRVYGDNATSRGLSVTRGSGYSYSWDATLTARQMIFDGFETDNRVEAAQARTQAADMNTVDVRENLALRAVQSYVNVLRVRDILARLKTHKSKMNDFTGRIEAAVDEGAADDSAYQQALDIGLMLEAMITNYKGQLRLANSDYLEVVGHAPDDDMARMLLPPDVFPQDMDSALEIAKTDHPALKSATYSAESAARDIESEEAQLYPDVDGELSYLKSEKDDVIGGEVVDAKALLRLNWSFETGGGHKARVRQKQEAHKESMARIREMLGKIERGVHQAYSELDTAETLLKTHRKRVDLNKKLLETYEVQFEGARITLLQLMQGENQLFNATLEQVETDYRAIAAHYAVLASVGRLQTAFEAHEAHNQTEDMSTSEDGEGA